MAKSKVRLIPVVVMQEDNRKWFNEYKSYRKPEGYDSFVERFLCFVEFQNKSFDTFVYEDLNRYKEILESTGHIKGNDFYAVKHFKNFLHNRYPKLFGETFLSDFSKYISHKKIDKTNGIILTLPQISYIRKYNKEEGDAYDEYMFETLFQLGIQKKYLKYCLPSYADFANRLFVFDDEEEPIEYNNVVEGLWAKILDEKVLEDKIKKINHQYFSKLTTYLFGIKVFPENRKLNSSDILVSHQVYFFTCPNCGNEFENVSESWVLTRMEFDDQYRLFCAQCKGVPNGH